MLNTLKRFVIAAAVAMLLAPGAIATAHTDADAPITVAVQQEKLRAAEDAFRAFAALANATVAKKKELQRQGVTTLPADHPYRQDLAAVGNAAQVFLDAVDALEKVGSTYLGRGDYPDYTFITELAHDHNEMFRKFIAKGREAANGDPLPLIF